MERKHRVCLAIVAATALACASYAADDDKDALKATWSAWTEGQVWAGRATTNSGKKPKGHTLDCSKQQLSTSFVIRVHKLKETTPNNTSDYYIVHSKFDHRVHGGVDRPGTNWLSVGFYAHKMHFDIQCMTKGAVLLEYMPKVMAQETTKTLSMGAGLSGTNPNASMTYSTTWNTKTTTVKGTADLAKAEVAWKVILPAVRAGHPNPGPESSDGFELESACLFQVPEGQALTLTAVPDVHWRYDFPRGTRYHGRRATKKFTKTFKTQ